MLDKWLVESVQPAFVGRTFLVRFADDSIMGFERLEDAQKVLRVIDKRFTRTLDAIKQWGCENRHVSLKEQPGALDAKLRGPDAYDGITFSFRMLSKLRLEVERVWLYWLNRRNRGRCRNWQQFAALLETLPLAPARIVHSCLQIESTA